ncbi:MarR family winged helix-turn-helix transcriptional regulator [Galactobacter valiniphilus]|uniref:MarR family winged helix-turn-helix transcriptional regulator n=1 Tax=Galactobacter valiniphilus TaxID=2676122 RepID=UPI00373603B5
MDSATDPLPTALNAACAPGSGRAGEGMLGEGEQLSEHDRSILAVEQEFARMVAGARRSMRARAVAMDPSLLPFDFKVVGALWHHDAHLPEHRGVTSRELTDLLETDKSMVSRSIKRLEEIGFVLREQDPHDARAQLIRLSSEAAERYAATSHKQRMEVQERLRSWNVEQVQQLAQLLLKLNGPRPDEPTVNVPVSPVEHPHHP